MLKAFILGIFLGAILLCAGAYFYISSGRAPAAVTDPPFPFESRIAAASLDAHIARQSRTEPAAPADESSLLAGAEVYKQNCAVCHGLPSQPVGNIADGMYPKPPQLFRGTGVTDDPVWETYWKAANGIRLTGMPGFKSRLTSIELWQVSQLLANADKISPTVKSALLAPPASSPAASKN